MVRNPKLIHRTISCPVSVETKEWLADFIEKSEKNRAVSVVSWP
jgi:hypothetical protein